MGVFESIKELLDKLSFALSLPAPRSASVSCWVSVPRVAHFLCSLSVLELNELFYDLNSNNGAFVEEGKRDREEGRGERLWGKGIPQHGRVAFYNPTQIFLPYQITC